MPNWCANNIIVNGKGKDVKQFIQENFRTNKYPYKEDSNEYAYILDFEQFCPTPLDDNGEVFSEWYNWRLSNWGCKWSPSYEQCIQLSIEHEDEEGIKIVYGEHENEDNEIFNESFVNSIPDDDCKMKLELSCFCETPWGPPEAMFIKWYEKYKDILEITMKFYEPGCCVLGELWFSGDEYCDKVIDDNDRKAYIEYLLTEGWECMEWYIDECTDMIEEMHSVEESELIVAKVTEVLNNCKTEDAATLIADIYDKYYKWMHEGDEKKGEQSKE